MLANRLITALTVAVLAAVSTAQDFNVDMGSPTHPVPSSSWPGVAGRAGHWSSYDPSNPSTFEDINGLPTSVTLVTETPFQHVEDTPSAGDDEGALALDYIDIWPFYPFITEHTITGLADGEYHIHVIGNGLIEILDSPDSLVSLQPNEPPPASALFGKFRVSVAGGSDVVIRYHGIEFHPGIQLNSMMGLQIVRLQHTDATAFCFGDGTASNGGGPVDCPCGNNAAPGSGTGCKHAYGHGARLSKIGSVSFADDDLAFRISDGPHGGALGLPSVLLQGSTTTALPFKDGILCAGNPTERVEIVHLDSTGHAWTTESITLNGNVPGPGVMRVYQAWFRDPGGFSPCGTGSNLTNALSIDYL